MTYGFIGLGNMAGAILRGMSASGKFAGDTVYGYNRSPEKTRRLAEAHGLLRKRFSRSGPRGAGDAQHQRQSPRCHHGHL